MNSFDKKLVGAIAVIGLGGIAGWFLAKNYVDSEIQEAYNRNLWGTIDVANSPAAPVSAAYLTPPATLAAPRMYVVGGAGSNPNRNPGESWLQGGGASITNTTGKWADFPGTYGGSFLPSGQFNPNVDLGVDMLNPGSQSSPNNDPIFYNA